MAMGKRRHRRPQPAMWIATSDLLTTAAHPFYTRLNKVLDRLLPRVGLGTCDRVARGGLVRRFGGLADTCRARTAIRHAGWAAKTRMRLAERLSRRGGAGGPLNGIQGTDFAGRGSARAFSALERGGGAHVRQEGSWIRILAPLRPRGTVLSSNRVRSHPRPCPSPLT